MGARQRIFEAIGLARPNFRNAVATEVRDPRAATQPIQGFSTMAKPMVPEWDADQAYSFAYYANIFVYACVKRCASALASMPIRAGVDPEKPGDFNKAARLAELLGPAPKGPAPKLSARKLIEWSVAQYLVTGRLAWELELGGPGFGNMDIVNIWPLVSSKFQAVPSTRGVDWFRAFVYNFHTPNPVGLTNDNTFYMWRPSQQDFRQPESALQSARLEISVAVMQERYDYAFLRNDARPATVVVHERFATSDAKDAFREQWQGSYGGPDNAGRVMFMEASDEDYETPMDVRGSLYVQTLGLTQADAQFIERYDKKIRAICVALGTPISLLADSSEKTYANADREARNWWRTTIWDLAQEFQDEINNQLAPRLDNGKYLAWFDTSNIPELKPDPFWQPEPLTNLVDTVISVGEAREAIGFPRDLPEDWKTSNVVAGAGEPPKAVAASVPAPPAPAATPRSSMLEFRDAIANGEDLYETRQVESIERQRAHSERRAAEAQQASDHFDALQIAWEAEFKRLFEMQRSAVLGRLKGRRGRSIALGQRDLLGESASGLFDADHWTGVTFKSAKSLYTQTATLAGKRINGKKVRAVNVLGTNGALFDIQRPQVQSFIEARSNQLAGQVTDTTYSQIKDELAAGVAGGETIDDLADRIGKVFDATDVRATTIARTESISGYNGATNTLFDTYGPDVVAGQEWLATNDDRTRDDHAEADGQRIGPDEQFSVGGESCDYPGDPSLSPEQSVNCRCTTLVLTPDDMGIEPDISGDGFDRSIPYDQAVRLVLLAGGAAK